MITQAEENYLKALYHVIQGTEAKKEAGTNALAAYLNIKPATVSEMLKKLKEKDLLHYQRYGKISLTKSGERLAIEVVRKHRLWECFLYEKLGFGWEEVHEVAEQLEHIQSAKLMDCLDKFLGYPEIDPHGDPIPNAKGEFKIRSKTTLAEMRINKLCKIVAVKDNSVSFLQYVVKLGLTLSSKIKVLQRQEFDGSMELEANGKRIIVSQKFAENIYVV